MATYDEVLSRTVGGRLLMQFKQELFECITVPNHCLPEDMRDNRSLDGRTLASLNKKCEQRDALTPHQQEKAEKARRVAMYSAQESRGEEISYEVDERRLNDKQLKFCAAAVSAGWMEFDDEE